MAGAVFGIYLAAGALFAIWFFITGFRRIDPTASSARWYTRLLWLPAAVALWPLLITKTGRNQ